MNLKLPKLPGFKLPGFGGAGARAEAALVIRSNAVELAWRARGKATQHERVELTAGSDEALVAAIRQAMTSAQLKSGRVAVSVASPEVLVRFFTMPMLPKAEWASAVQFEARKYIPFKIDTLVWDYAAAPARAPEPDGERLEAVFVGMPREVFERLKAVLAAAGVQAAGIEPLSRTLARLAGGADDLSRFECVVEVGPHSAHVVIARGGVPYLTRDVQAAAPAPVPGQPDAPAAASLAQRLASELNLSFDFFRRESHAAAVSRVVVFGDEGMARDCAAQMASMVAVPVEAGHAPGGTPPGFAAAAALLEQGQGAPVIEFLSRARVAGGPAAVPSAAHKIKPAQMLAIARTPRAMGTAMVTAAALIAGLWMLGNAQVAREDQRLQALRRARPRIADRVAAMNAAALQPVEAGLKEQAQFLKSVIDGRLLVAAKLDALARSLPDGVWLTGLSFASRPDAKGVSAGQLTIQGACFLGASERDLKAIQEFESRVKHELKLVQDMPTVQLGQIDAAVAGQQSSPYRTFQLQCQSKGKL